MIAPARNFPTTGCLEYVAVILIHVVSRRGEAAFPQNTAFAPTADFN
jgi:hypothetical protein